MHLKLLCDQGLPRPQLNIVFDALVLSRLRYAVHVWSGFMSVELELKGLFFSALLNVDFVANCI